MGDPPAEGPVRNSVTETAYVGAAREMLNDNE